MSNNIRARQKSVSEPERTFLKLMTNSIYGKMLQNKMEELNTHIVSDPYTAIKLISSERFDRYQIINSSTSFIHMKKASVLLNTHNIIGAILLDLAKLHMLRIYYGVLKPAFSDKLRLFYSDTDSLGLILDVQDPYPILSKLVLDGKSLFDFSSLPNSHSYYDHSYAGQPGLLKDEVGDGVISRYVGICKKMYCLDINLDSGNEFKKNARVLKPLH